MDKSQLKEKIWQGIGQLPKGAVYANLSGEFRAGRITGTDDGLLVVKLNEPHNGRELFCVQSVWIEDQAAQISENVSGDLPYIQPQQLDSLTFETGYHSLFSNQLVIKLAGGESLQFFGSTDDTNYTEKFCLLAADGEAFHFEPGTPAEMVEQLKTAITNGYSYLDTGIN